MKKTLLVVLAAMLLISAAVIADPVIKISGVIALRNEEGVWQLTLDEFKELPQTEFFCNRSVDGRQDICWSDSRRSVEVRRSSFRNKECCFGML